MAATLVPPIDPDPSLGGVRELFSSEGMDLIAFFLSTRGFEPQSLRPVQALYRPGSSCIVRYRVRAVDRAGRDRHLTICAETRVEPKEPRRVPDDFAERHRFPDPVERMGAYLVWTFPYDPGLKEMSDAAWTPWAKEALSASGQGSRAVNVQPVMYRPRRRAMFRYLGLGGSEQQQSVTYAKVLRSPRVARSLEVAKAMEPKRALLDRLLKRPPPLRLLLPVGQAGSNTLLFKPAPGTSLRDLLLKNQSLPHPSRVVDVVKNIARLGDAAALGASPRHGRAPAELAQTTGDLVTRLLPDSTTTVARLIETIRRGSEADGLEPCVVHGDLYDGQIFIDDDFSLSLIDLDDVGVGDAALDIANFCAHLLVMALSIPEAKDRLTAYRTVLRQEFMKSFDVSSEMLSWREALVVMQLALGPFRVLDPQWPQRVLRRLELAAKVGGVSADGPSVP